MSDSALRRQVAQLAAELARTQAEVRTLRRGARRPQLGHSSIDSGSLDVVDSETGQVRLRLGYQPDGSVGVVPEGGDPHPAPATPVVEPIPSGLSVSWNGSLSGLDTLPADFDHVNVHVSQVDGFAPEANTFTGTITRSGGVLPVAPLEVGETYYVRLVPVGTGGVQGAPSAQASGVPAPVGGVPGPGSITETEIADDAISTPKLQAEAVTALKIAAQAIEAGHIQAAAITASKLEADLVLGTRIIAGSPAGARVELDENGLRGYDDTDALVFAITDGNAVFTGNITGSVISGSRILMGAAPDPHGAIEETSSGVQVRVQHGTHVAQLRASVDQANFLAARDATDPSTPAVGFSTTSTGVQFVVDSSALISDGLPSITGLATPSSAQLSLWSTRNDLGSARATHIATSGSASAEWHAGSGSSVQVTAGSGSASMRFTPAEAADPGDQQGAGSLFANRSPSDDIAAVSLQSPRWEMAGSPASLRRSVLFAEGANTGRPYTRMVHAARRVLVMGEATGGAYDTTSDGVLDLADTHSIRAPRHTPATGTLQGQLTSYSTGSDFYDFPSGLFAPFTFKTGWSGWIRVTINICALNPASGASTVSLGFRLSGAGTLAADLSRAAGVRSIGAGVGSNRQSHWSKPLSLAGNATYTLTPCYRITSGSVTTFDQSFDNSITVEPLM